LNRERGEFSKRFQNNIIGNFENRLSLTEEGKTIAIAYDIEGSKASGYKLTATVTYESKSEIDPRMIGISARWNPVFDAKEWNKRIRRQAKRMVEESRGRKVARDLVPDEDEDEEE
jgi:hypothetical protein